MKLTNLKIPNKGPIIREVPLNEIRLHYDLPPNMESGYLAQGYYDPDMFKIFHLQNLERRIRSEAPTPLRLDHYMGVLNNDIKK